MGPRSLYITFNHSFGQGKFFRGPSINFQSNTFPRFNSPAPGPCYACGEFSHFRKNCPYDTRQGLSNEGHAQGGSRNDEIAKGEDSNLDFMKDEYHFDYDRFTHDFYEYEQGQKHIIVRGQLKQHIQFCKSIGASDFIIDVIENGYKLPLYSEPEQTFFRNNRSAIAESDFVAEAIQDLLDRSLIQQSTDILTTCCKSSNCLYTKEQ